MFCAVWETSFRTESTGQYEMDLASHGKWEMHVGPYDNKIDEYGSTGF